MLQILRSTCCPWETCCNPHTAKFQKKKGLEAIWTNCCWGVEGFFIWSFVFWHWQGTWRTGATIWPRLFPAQFLGVGEKRDNPLEMEHKATHTYVFLPPPLPLFQTDQADHTYIRSNVIVFVDIFLGNMFSEKPFSFLIHRGSNPPSTHPPVSTRAPDLSFYMEESCLWGCSSGTQKHKGWELALFSFITAISPSPAISFLLLHTQMVLAGNPLVEVDVTKILGRLLRGADFLVIIDYPSWGGEKDSDEWKTTNSQQYVWNNSAEAAQKIVLQRMLF